MELLKSVFVFSWDSSAVKYDICYKQQKRSTCTFHSLMTSSGYSEHYTATNTFKVCQENGGTTSTELSHRRLKFESSTKQLSIDVIVKSSVTNVTHQNIMFIV